MQTHRLTSPSPKTGPFNTESGVYFVEGVAYTDLPGVIAYCRSAGYTVEPVDQVPADYVAAADAGRVGMTIDLGPKRIAPPAPGLVGTPLRDAAVDPQPGDASVPSNAGQAHPHSPLVVSPEAVTREDQAQAARGDVA